MPSKSAATRGSRTAARNNSRSGSKPSSPRPLVSPTPTGFGDSWQLADWPPHVYPNDAKRARYLVRANLTSLRKARAVVRVGRVLVINGDQFRAWLAGNERALAVTGFRNNLHPDRSSSHE